MRAIPKQDAEQKSETREALVHTDLVLSRLEADIIAKLEHAGERIVQHGNALLAQGEIQHHHLGRYAASKRAMCQLVLGGVDGNQAARRGTAENLDGGAEDGCLGWM